MTIQKSLRTKNVIENEKIGVGIIIKITADHAHSRTRMPGNPRRFTDIRKRVVAIIPKEFMRLGFVGARSGILGMTIL